MLRRRITSTASHNTKIDNQQVFECSTNTTLQNTTTKNQPQTHDTIQDSKFGMYRLAVRFQN